MNLRILKKLSKRAASLLPLLGDARAQFPSEKSDNYHGVRITARKHFERCPSIHSDRNRSGEIVFVPKCRVGGQFPYIKLYPPCHPRKGTIMVGSMSGYYEPEWDEECAYSALEKLIFGHFTDYLFAEGEGEAVSLRRLRTPRDIFRAASDILAERVQ